MKPQTEIQKELKEAFKLFSRGSGSLNIKQLRSALTKLGEKLSEDEVEELFDMMDENEDGVVDVDGKLKLFHISKSIQRSGTEAIITQTKTGNN